MTHSLPSPWDLYLHTATDASQYGSSFRRFMHVATCEDWGRMWNHSHPDLVGQPQAALCFKGGCYVTAWSFFRSSCRPEWEHPAHYGGVTLTARSDATSAERHWQALILDCARGAAPFSVLGVQVTRKWGRGSTTVSLKWDVWLERDACQSDVVRWLHALTNLPFAAALRR